MIEIRRILCPVDFSDCSRRAVDHAVAIARWYGSTVTALHVFTIMPVAAAPTGPVILEPSLLTPELRNQLVADARRLLAESAPGIATEPLLRQGAAVGEILDQARSMAADLIVMGTHGRSGVDRLLLGSVTERVLRKASCPVLTVPPAMPDAIPTAPVLYKRIICPVDFSESSMRALDYAASLAREADAQLTVLHVVHTELEIPFDYPVGDTSMTLAEFQKRREEEAQRRLETAIPAEAAAYCRPDHLLLRGKPWREILRVAEQRQADLIVMGVQGRGAADLMFFGSTTQHVVRQAACPVLTIRGK